MPFQRRIRRQRGMLKRFGKRSFKRKMMTRNTKANQKLVIYNRPRMPFPPAYQCRFEAFMDFQLNAAVASVFSFGVYQNVLYKPFNVTGLQIDRAGSNMTINDSYATATFQPQGFSNLCNTGSATNAGPYSYYRVFASKIIVQVLPVVISDSLEVMVIPTISPNALPANFTAALADRFMKVGFAGPLNPSGNKIANFVRTHDLFGVPKSAILNDVAQEYSAAASGVPTNEGTWYVILRTADGANVSTSTNVKIRVTYWARLEQEQAKRELTI